MERDENGRPLAKTGKCSTCGKRLRVLADEDFDCCFDPLDWLQIKPIACFDCNGTGSNDDRQEHCRTCRGSGEL